MNTAIDMGAFIVAKSDQLNADDLLSGPRTIRVTGVRANEDSAEQPVSINYEGDQGKPFKPCKTMRRVMVAVWGRDASKYMGRSMTLYRDEKVQFGGMQVGGIRISHMTGLDEPKTLALTATRGKKAGYKVMPLTVEEPKGRQTADEWAAEFIGAIEATATIDSLDALWTKNQRPLAKLAKERGELCDQIEEVRNARLAMLSAEKRDEPDFGDQFDD